MPGINYNFYTGGYWPARIETVKDEGAYEFLEKHLYLLPLTPRQSNYSVLSDTKVRSHLLSWHFVPLWRGLVVDQGQC